MQPVPLGSLFLYAGNRKHLFIGGKNNKSSTAGVEEMGLPCVKSEAMSVRSSTLKEGGKLLTLSLGSVPSDILAAHTGWRRRTG